MRNFAFPGYAELGWTRSAIRARQPLRVPPWGQAGSLPCDGDRLEAYPTMGTGWKPTLRWGQAGSLPCDGDRLEAYPAMVTGWKPILRW